MRIRNAEIGFAGSLLEEKSLVREKAPEILSVIVADFLLDSLRERFFMAEVIAVINYLVLIDNRTGGVDDYRSQRSLIRCAAVG